MKIAIIGAGFGGLAVAYRLSKAGHAVTVIESEEKPGGLAIGFQEKKWDWSLEKHYHHWFTNDDAVLTLASEIGHNVLIKRPITSTFIDGKIRQLDSPLSLLLFSKLPFVDRIRMGIVLAYLRFTSKWQPLEKITAEEFVKKYMGRRSWEVLWGPLFRGKFSIYAKDISAAWFWARIKKRTPSLAYPEGGFLAFAEHLADVVTKQGGKILYKTKVSKISKKNQGIHISTDKGNAVFDKVVCTLPTPLFVRLTMGLPEDYKNNLQDLNGIGAVNLVLSLNKEFLSGNAYWLNITASHFPFLAVVEHTHFMDKEHYNNEHLLYVGNYLPHDHRYYKKEAIELLREFYPFLKTINPKFNSPWVNEAYVFKAPFAQPIMSLNYSEKIPPFETPIENLYLCNMQQVYPWDRGTNYAVENGEKVAQVILESSNKNEQ